MIDKARLITGRKGNKNDADPQLQHPPERIFGNRYPTSGVSGSLKHGENTTTRKPYHNSAPAFRWKLMICGGPDA